MGAVNAGACENTLEAIPFAMTLSVNESVPSAAGNTTCTVSGAPPVATPVELQFEVVA